MIDAADAVRSVSFRSIDATCWCLLDELMDLPLGTHVQFDGLAEGSSFDPAVSRLLTGVAADALLPLGPRTAASVEEILADDELMYGLRAVHHCQVQEAIPAATSSDAWAECSIINSQRRAYVLASTASPAHLPLADPPARTRNGPCTLLVRQKVLGPGSPVIIGRSFIVVD